MALMMVFSNQEKETYRKQAKHLGFDFYQTDNIYQFLRYASEVHPDLVVMHFNDDFNNDTAMMKEVKKALCPNNICPQIFLNQPKNFDGTIFFENMKFEKSDEQTRF